MRTSLADRPVPAATAGPVTEDRAPVLLWVHTGSATVEAAGAQHRLASRQAIWIPPGVEHCTRTDEDSVVLPIFPRLPEAYTGSAGVHVLTIPSGWEDWLVFQFDFNKYHSLGARSGTSALLALVTQSSSGDARNPDELGVPSLPMPHSAEGRAVAQSLLASLSSPRQVEHFAAQQNVSVRTLQRQFRNETGMVFSQWRARARATVAARHLADGQAISWTGHQVGYASPAGFARGFRQHFGVSPRQYAREARTLDDIRERATRATAQLAALVADDPPEPPLIPARQVWDWVYDWHVLWWVYRGTVDVRIGSQELSMRRGEAFWLPAGISASVRLAEGAILLPLGNRHGGAPISVDRLRTFSLPDDAETLLLHTVLAEYTLFAPESSTGLARLADELFLEQFVSGRDDEAGDELTGAVATIARALRRDPADARSLADWAGDLDLSPRRLSREFLSQTGHSFPRWRGHLRMSLARELLMYGDPPHAVAKSLGYATPAAFSQVFTTAHGSSPRSFQRHVSREHP